VALTKKQKTAVWLGVGFVAFVALVVPRILTSEPDTPGAPARAAGGGDTLAVTVAPVAQERLEDRVATTGTLLPWEAVDLRAEVAGRVTSLSFEEGTRVRQGQTLVTLDTRVLQAQIESARTRRDLAGVQAERRRELFAIGGLSRQALDEAESAARVLDAELAELGAEVARRRVVAPFAGVVGLREVSVGAYLSPGDRVATLRVTSPLRLEFSVPERYLGQIREGDGVTFRVPGQEVAFGATVTAAEPAVDPLTRAFTVRARVGNPDDALRPGAFADVQLVLDAIDDALLVPTASVITGADAVTVFVVEGGAAARRVVTTGVRTADRIQITSGLQPGDVVLTSGLDEVREGQPVRTGGAFDPTRVRPDAPAERSRRFQTAD
jgi:membrane fusion protein (multidrug efflux system)